MHSGGIAVDVEAKDVAVDLEKMTAVIDARDSKVIYIVENEKVQAIPLPQYGTLEIQCQNHNIGNLSYKITLKR